MQKKVNKEEKKRQEKREERGLWQASSFIKKEIKELTKYNKPIHISLIIKAHKILFTAIGSQDANIGGKYRKRNDQELKRIDGTFLKMADFNDIGSKIAILDDELKVKTKNLKRPIKRKQYKNVINLAAVLSHQFVLIHPFENGNGRASRLLLNAILKRAGLYWLDSDVSVSLKKKEKEKYLRAMLQADDGDYLMLEKMINNSLLQTSRKLYKQRMRKL